MRRLFTAAACLLLPVAATAADGNRLAYLDESDPYYVSRSFPRLTTPQWVGKEGVEAVVVLAIDDMREPERYERFLRPALQRLKKIDGRCPVSIMTCKIDPKHDLLERWLKEGLSLETHTIDHPCPLLRDANLDRARATYERCVDQMAEVPGNRPVAFRMPCCDSLNTLSPRFFSELFSRRTEKGHFLELDSSVFNVTTANDPELPRRLVLDSDGRERFGKYVPAGRSFVNTIADYPYPYVINRLCWELPCATPSDWQSQFLQGPGNPVLLSDWKAQLDATVLKKGIMSMVFHPYTWSRPEQLADFVDYAVERYAGKVLFLTFREVKERLEKNLPGGQSLRAADGSDNGVRLLDLDGDGLQDVIIANDRTCQTRLWSAAKQTWLTSELSSSVVEDGKDTGVRFGALRPGGRASMVVKTEKRTGVFHFDGVKWVVDGAMMAAWPDIDGRPVFTAIEGRDEGVRLRDLDGDGVCELIVANDRQQAVFRWSVKAKRWERLPFGLPPGARFVDARGRDAGLRFVDIDEDGRLDLLFSNDEVFGLYLFESMEKGWSRKALAGRKGDAGALPQVVRNGTNNGAWFHSRHLWVQNENTAHLKDHVDRRSFNEMLASVEPAAKDRTAALRSLRPRPGFQVEEMAAEPLVQDPIAMAWGPDGKLWVVEMGDYPLGIDGKGKGGGKVLFLEDTDGDGKYDKATVFLDNLAFPSGVTPWGKGVLVTSAPDIFYAEDTDGDGKADRREVLYTGFVEGNQQHRVNGLVWGLDNWLYGANGDSGGKVRSVKTGAVVDIRGRDFRIRPSDGAIEAVSGQTQFGRCRDDWGNWFGNNNSNPFWHYPLDEHYLRRNPHLASPDPRVTVPVVPGAAPVYPVSRTLPRFNDFFGFNRFTSACSPIIYRDDLFGPTYAGNCFVSEPVHNLVHREIVSPKGVTFTSRRAIDEQQSEFLASSDNWFRPTSIRVGPDGALWVADMYRQVIEHPEWIPKDWQKRLDLRAGHDKGRIYRVVPVGVRPRPIPGLDRLDGPGLARALDSPSGWQRDMAQQMLVQSQDKSAVPTLVKLTRSDRPQCRLHALCTLEGLGALTTDLLVQALGDAHPGVRRHAVRLCEPLLPKDHKLDGSVLELIDDPDPLVRMQLVYTLGEWPDPQTGEALGKLLRRDFADPYFAAAAFSSVNARNIASVLQGTFSVRGTPPAELVDRLLRLATATGNKRALAELLAAVTTPEKGRFTAAQLMALSGLLDVLDRQETSLDKLRADGGEELKRALQGTTRALQFARDLAARADAPATDRTAAAAALGRGFDHQAEDLDLLAGLIVPQVPEEVQATAVTTLGKLRGPRVAEALLRGWKGQGPRVRSAVLDALLSREEWSAALLGAIEKKNVLPLEIDTARQQRLVGHRNVAIRERATRAFAGTVNADRQKVIAAYRPALALPGEGGRGKQVFAKTCAACHRLDGVGQEVGPDLAALADKPAETLLVAILDPNQAVESRYVNYLAETKDGRTFTGLIASESGNSLTLVGADGKAKVLLRSEIEELTSTGKSLMPEGLEKELKPQDIADLLAYVKANAPPVKRKTFAGNNPDVVHAAADGSLLLSAASAEIYGPTVVFEGRYDNLGYWTSEEDHAAWTVEVPRAGRYAVWLDWACPDSVAGNAFVLQAGEARLSGKVAPTGSWDTYQQSKAGSIDLPAGRARLVFRSQGKIEHGALIDLKSIKLIAPP